MVGFAFTNYTFCSWILYKICNLHTIHLRLIHVRVKLLLYCLPPPKCVVRVIAWSFSFYHLSLNLYDDDASKEEHQRKHQLAESSRSLTVHQFSSYSVIFFLN